MTENFIQEQPDVLLPPFPIPYPQKDPTFELLGFWGKVAIVVAAGIVIIAGNMLSKEG